MHFSNIFYFILRDPQYLYIVMDFMEGKDLRKHLDRRFLFKNHKDYLIIIAE